MSKYSICKTLDNSLTFKNSIYDENYHSNAGAWQEARIKYFDACRIRTKIEKSSCIHIMELGFGLGYNLIPVFLYSKGQGAGKIIYTSFELDDDIFKRLMRESKKLYPSELRMDFIQLLENHEFKSANLELKIIKNDIRKEILKIPGESIDAIYHDPFSPYKNTECWTLELFKEYYRVLKNDGIISTYSISTPVRSGFYQAGFSVWKGVGDETKSGGTIASKEDLGFDKLTEKERKKLFESPERIPFSDPDFKLGKDEIKRIRQLSKESGDYSLIKRLS